MSSWGGQPAGGHMAAEAQAFAPAGGGAGRQGETGVADVGPPNLWVRNFPICHSVKAGRAGGRLQRGNPPSAARAGRAAGRWTTPAA